jgi:hypothetical protein
MKTKFNLATSVVGFLLAQVASAGSVVNGFQYDQGLLVANPAVSGQWLAVDDFQHRCQILSEVQADANGAQLRDEAGAQWLASSWGVLYTRGPVQAAWTVAAEGTWISQEEDFGWSHDQFATPNPDAKSPLPLHHFLWRGAGNTFLNDPRPGDNFYDINPQHGHAWYHLTAGHCDWLKELDRQYEQPDIETVFLKNDNGLVWTVTTGRASAAGQSEVAGDWLP